MPITPELPVKLHEKLGDDAMTELASLFGDLGAEGRAADARLEAQFVSGLATIRDEIVQLGHELRREFRQESAGITSRLEQQIANLGADVKVQISAAQAELIKWTFLFWVGTIGLVVLLLRFPQ